MKRLCYGTFATVLKLCSSSGVTQIMLHDALLSAVDEIGVVRDGTQASRWFNCKGNLSRNLIDAMREADTEVLSAHFKDKVIPLIDPNKISVAALAIRAIIAEDVHIASGTVVDCVNNTTKMELIKTPISLPADFLVGVFIYAVLHVPNSVGNECIAEIDEAFLADVTKLDMFVPEVHKVYETFNSTAKQTKLWAILEQKIPASTQIINKACLDAEI